MLRWLRKERTERNPGDDGELDRFDWQLYLERYPDLRAAGIHTESAARQHWLRHGRRENRWATRPRRPPRETLTCPSVDSIYLRATGDLVCWDDAGNDTVLQAWDETLHYGRDVWLGEPYEAVRRSLWNGRMPFPACESCLVLQSRGRHSSEAVDRRRLNVFQVEPSFHCSLDCPGCVPLAVRRAAPPSHLDPAVFERVLRDFRDADITIRGIDFQGHGEPLLHPRLWDLVRTARRLYPGAHLSMTTNCQATVKNEAVTSGLDTLVCAIDGARPESYSAYRVHGDFHLAMAFMTDFAARRKELGISTRIVWKYVLFRHNSSEAELRDVQQMAVEAGVDELRFVLTRNGPATVGVVSAGDLPRPPDGLLQTFEHHEPDALELAARIKEAGQLLSGGDPHAAQDLAVSAARNLARFFPRRLPVNSPHRDTVADLLTMARELPEPTCELVQDLVGHLSGNNTGDHRTSGWQSPAPTPSDVARTVDLVRQARRHLGYAPLVTGLRPLYQDDRLLFPQFVTSAEGSILTDTCQRRLIDWMSGYGAVVLGYGNPEVEAAVREQLSCGPVLPFGHPLEIEVARRLVRLIPCAEAVGFGKNGSDVLTAAVRIARLVTGREVVLFHGYHGFQDWFAAANPAIGGIPGALRELVEEFPWNDIRALEALLTKHQGKVAAVVMEPIKQLLPKPGWLEAVKELAHRHGALLIFDEIVTGFRVGLGGAQALLSVIPDMACFGKAMANGWSISALTGRRDLVCRWPEIGVDMTWRAELPSMAAAVCTMDILERDHVAEKLAGTGERLRQGFAGIARELNVAARLTGHPSRLNIQLDAAGGLPSHQILEGFIDQCLRNGLVTNGTLLPNASHGDAEIRATLSVFRRALAEVRRAVLIGAFEGPGTPRGPKVSACLDSVEERPDGLAAGGWLFCDDGRPLDVYFTGPSGTTLTCRRNARPDVALAFPASPGAQHSGWTTLLPRAGFVLDTGEWSFLIRAVLSGREHFRCHVVLPQGLRRLPSPVELPNGQLVEPAPR